MISLEKQSGLPLFWNGEEERLVFGEGLNGVRPDIRTKTQMKDVLFEPDGEGPEDLYYMYRGVSRVHEAEAIAKHGLRYDITFLRPGTVGREYIKTAGHYHPCKAGSFHTYPEVYEVLFGRAHYLMQSPREDNCDQLEKVLLIAAKPGDKVLIPPGFGHITINPGEDFLIMANWVASDFSSVYEPMLLKGGGAYFELRGDEGPEFVPNSRYLHIPTLKRCPVTPVPRFNLHTGLPMYRVFQDDPDVFSFLYSPENYEAVFGEYLQELLQDFLSST